MAKSSGNRTTRLRERRQRRKALRLRPLLAALAWLDGAPRWHDGRPVWLRAAVEFTPGPAELAEAAETLARLARHPALLAELVGEPERWLTARRTALAEAIYLVQRPQARLDELLGGARMSSAAALRTLAELLPAEVLCREGLPRSPAAALAARGSRALPALAALLADDAAPRLGRALAAMVAGAVCRGVAAERPPVLPPWALVWAAYRYGLAHGLPRQPGLALAALEGPDGEQGALALERALAARHPFCLNLADVHGLRAAGHSAATVVALALAADGAGPLVARMLAYESWLRAERRTPLKRARALEQFRAVVARLATRFRTCLVRSGEPEVGRLAVALLTVLLDLSERAGPCVLAADLLLERAAELPPELIRPYLALLLAEHARIWLPAALPKRDAPVNDFDAALRRLHERVVAPTGTLLRHSREPAVVRAALVGGYVLPLSRRRLRDRRLYGWLARRLRAFPNPNEALVNMLLEVAARFPGLDEARAALDPLLGAVMAAPPGSRAIFVDLLLDGLSRNREALARDLPRLASYARLIVPACSASTAPLWVEPVAVGVLALDRRDPDVARQTLLLLMAQAPGWDDKWHIDELRQGLLLAAAVGADPGEAAAMVEAALRAHTLGSRECEVGIAALQSAPGLRRAIRRLFVQRPRHMGELLAQIGLAAAIGPGALAPLALLEAAPATEPRDAPLVSAAPGWRELLALAPCCADDAAALLNARWVLGQGFELPPGVARALAQPERDNRERAHLAQLVARTPERADLAARLAALTARLDDQRACWAAAAAEAAERLAQVAAETQVAAAEALLREVAANRLKVLGAALPATTPLDAAMLNAVLLWRDAGANRPQLRTLLRALGEGRPGWRELLPANAALLRLLADAGANVEAWLGPNLASYPFPGLAGGQIRLALEQDPLQVLQMGNLFFTCLSRGSVNAFATMANAVDLNKRVLYARDGAGRVVGRKLVALTAELRLVGFHTYRNCEPELAAALEALIERYLREFAARCRLELADDGEVPTLEAAAWYNDGPVPWDRTADAASPAEVRLNHFFTSVTTL